VLDVETYLAASQPAFVVEAEIAILDDARAARARSRTRSGGRRRECLATIRGPFELAPRAAPEHTNVEAAPIRCGGRFWKPEMRRDGRRRRHEARCGNHALKDLVGTRCHDPNPPYAGGSLAGIPKSGSRHPVVRWFPNHSVSTQPQGQGEKSLARGEFL